MLTDTDLLTCPVCLNTLEDPVQLICQHCVCRQCAGCLMATDDAPLVCPYDGVAHPGPLNDLPPASEPILASLMELVSLPASRPAGSASEEPICERCEAEIATLRCGTCALYLCEPCSSLIHTGRLRLHATTFELVSHAQPRSSTEHLRCATRGHSGEPAVAYDSTEGFLVCESCRQAASPVRAVGFIGLQDHRLVSTVAARSAANIASALRLRSSAAAMLLDVDTAVKAIGDHCTSSTNLLADLADAIAELARKHTSGLAAVLTADAEQATVDLITARKAIVRAAAGANRHIAYFAKLKELAADASSEQSAETLTDLLTFIAAAPSSLPTMDAPFAGSSFSRGTHSASTSYSSLPSEVTVPLLPSVILHPFLQDLTKGADGPANGDSTPTSASLASPVVTKALMSQLYDLMMPHTDAPRISAAAWKMSKPVAGGAFGGVPLVEQLLPDDEACLFTSSIHRNLAGTVAPRTAAPPPAALHSPPALSFTSPGYDERSARAALGIPSSQEHILNGSFRETPRRDGVDLFRASRPPGGLLALTNTILNANLSEATTAIFNSAVSLNWGFEQPEDLRDLGEDYARDVAMASRHVAEEAIREAAQRKQLLPFILSGDIVGVSDASCGGHSTVTFRHVGIASACRGIPSAPAGDDPSAPMKWKWSIHVKARRMTCTYVAFGVAIPGTPPEATVAGRRSGVWAFAMKGGKWWILANDMFPEEPAGPCEVPIEGTDVEIAFDRTLSILYLRHLPSATHLVIRDIPPVPLSPVVSGFGDTFEIIPPEDPQAAIDVDEKSIALGMCAKYVPPVKLAPVEVQYKSELPWPKPSSSGVPTWLPIKFTSHEESTGAEQAKAIEDSLSHSVADTGVSAGSGGSVLSPADNASPGPLPASGLVPGDNFSLDSAKPNLPTRVLSGSMSWVAYKTSAAALPCYVAEPFADRVSEAPPTAIWSIRWSDDKARWYYANASLKKTAWQLPKEVTPP